MCQTTSAKEKTKQAERDGSVWGVGTEPSETDGSLRLEKSSLPQVTSEPNLKERGSKPGGIQGKRSRGAHTNLRLQGAAPGVHREPQEVWLEQSEQGEKREETTSTGEGAGSPNAV